MTWKPIKGYEGLYEISEDGTIRSLPRFKKYRGKKPRRFQGCIKHPGINNVGYYTVRLNNGEGSKLFLLHRLIAEAFIPNDDPEHKKFVDHINGIKTDNSLSNLEWVTQRENNIRAYNNGLKVGPKRKLTESDVREIRQSDDSYSQLASKYGVDIKTVWKAKKGMTYKDVI